ncbi:MAG: hypothetical protein WCK34_08940 [Bacteroidota bacterium]
MINRFSRRESLPLLRGMFVFPAEARRKKDAPVIDFVQIPPEAKETPGAIERIGKLIQQTADFSCFEEDGLYITAKEGAYLGG